MWVGNDEYCCEDQTYCATVPYTLELEEHDCRLVQYVGMDRADFYRTRKVVWTAQNRPAVRDGADDECELRLEPNDIVVYSGETALWSLNVTDLCPECEGSEYGVRLSSRGGIVPYAI